MREPIQARLAAKPAATADRPLSGLTALLVEDSLLCAEAVRLLCRRSGARLRRANGLQSARRHLVAYRPSLVIVDIGLPDGSGLDLVKSLARRPAAPVVLVISGEDADLCRGAALAAGADGFIAKPVRSIRAFQQAVLSHFPGHLPSPAGNVVPFCPIGAPDRRTVALDLQQAHALLGRALALDDRALVLYGAQFLRSVAAAADDRELSDLAHRLGKSAGQGRPLTGEAARLRSVLVHRIGASSPKAPGA